MKNFSFLLVAILNTFLFTSIGHAFILSPMSYSFEPSGKKSVHSFKVTNNNNQTIQLQNYVVERVMDKTGKEKNDRIKDDQNLFTVYPPQMMLKPKESRIVRVSWVGDKNPPRELNYRLAVEQLPLNEEGVKGGTIKILFKKLAAIYVTPPKAKYHVEIVDAKYVEVQNPKTKKKEPKLYLLMSNTGLAHKNLLGWTIKVEPKDSSKASFKKVELTEKNDKSFNTQNVLNGQEREFYMIWPTSVPKDADIKVSIDFDF